MSDARAFRAGLGIQQSNPYVDVSTIYDVSALAPGEQFNALVQMIEASDAAHPAPYTNTPPYGEPTPEQEITPEYVIDGSYLPPAELQGYTDDELTPIISDAHSPLFAPREWENDPQYYGLGVPPGVPNWNQPVESGHTQIVVLDPSAENGWDEWSGKPKIARVARHENDFKGYGKGASSGHMVNIASLQPNARASAVYFTAQKRDLLLAELQKRGLHNIVVSDVPALTYTEQVAWVDPTSYVEYPFTEAGVL